MFSQKLTSREQWLWALAQIFLFSRHQIITKREKNEPQIEAFMQADGSQSLLSSEKSFAKIHQQKDDLLVWFGGDKIYQAIDANLPETNFVMYNGGTETSP